MIIPAYASASLSNASLRFWRLCTRLSHGDAKPEALNPE